MSTELTPEQRAAVEQRDTGLFVHANAGSGKTRVLVERFARAVLEDDVPVERILAITFTEKAAAELKARIRTRFLAAGRRDLARQAEGAWVSTIHGLCSKLLRRHALAAGIDPEYEVLNETRAARLAIDAFDRAIEAFLDTGDPVRLDLAAAHTPDRLRRMVTAVHAKLRSGGQEQPELPEIDPPPRGGEREALAQAVDAALRELEPHSGAARVDDAIATLERCRDALAALAPDATPDPAEFKELRVSPGRTRALQGDAVAEACAALEAFLAACAAQRGYRDYVLLRELLDRHGREYAHAKERESALDFDDLELLTCRLLEEHDVLRDRYRDRFVHVLVDEFQDTNRLQIRLLRLLTGEQGRLFTVGDEFQSIYGFRHADVDVFRAYRAQAAEHDRVRPLSANFRSRAEILTALNAAFGPHWGDEFQPLEPGRARAQPPESGGQLELGVDGVAPAPPGTAVELIVADQAPARWNDLGDAPFGQSLAALPAWRAAETRLLADRVRRLIREEGRRAGEIVVLLRAAADMARYERALRERGIDTYVAGGREFWTQQQVTDLRAYLAVLANPLDEQALYSVLGSPLCGLSLDALARLALAARRLGRDAWWTLSADDGSAGLLDSFPAADADRARDLVARVDAHRVLAAAAPLERLLDRVIRDGGYDRALLALPDGRRRMANVRKLMRMAREFEAERGADLRGFIDHLAEQELLAAREGEAPLEAEDLDAVRLMTIHAAKGLEFPVVCVADLGRLGKGDDDALRVTDDGRVGLKIASLGGGSAKSLDLERIEQEQERLQDEEERRIFYVAMTRAQELLVLSGATDVEKWPDPEPLGVPMNWVWRGMAPGLAVGAPRGARCTVCTAANVDELLDEAGRYGERAVGEDVPVPVAPLRAFERHEAAPALPVGRLSYSGLARYRACGYRFYLEKVVGLAELEPVAGDEDAAPDPPGSDELAPLLRGTVVHELLEQLDFGDPRVPSVERVAEMLGAHGAEPGPAAVEDVRRFVAGFLDVPLFGRLAAAPRVRKELAFAYELSPPGAGGRSLLVNGFLDVYAEEDDRVLIVDYKTDAVDDADPETLCESQYSIQRLIYALAALRAGAPAVEVAYCFLERPDAPVARSWSAADADALERELLDLAAGVIEGRFEPSSAPHRQLCAQCAGRPSLCSWDEDATTRPAAATLGS